MKIGLFFHKIAFITEFPGSNFLLPTFLTGGKWDFQVANLLLATVNFELCSEQPKLHRVLAVLSAIGLRVAHLKRERTIIRLE